MLKPWLGDKANWKSWLVPCIVVAFFLFTILLDHVNGRFWMHDYKVYYSASQAMFSGNVVYGLPFGLGSGFYKYSPCVLFFFYPLALLPYYISSIVFYVILCSLNFRGIFSINNFIGIKIFIRSQKEKFWLYCLLTFVVVASHIHRELHLGNINIFLLVLFFVALKQITKGEKLVGGFLIGLGILFKPHFLIIIPLLFLWRRWGVLVGVGLSIFIGFVVPGLIFGWAKNIQLHQKWFEAMTNHNANILEGINTIYYYPVSLLDPANGVLIKWVSFFILMLVALGVGLLHFYVKFNKNKGAFFKESNAFQFEYFLLLGLIPSLTITDTEHFLLSMPLIIFSFYCWKYLAHWERTMLVIGLVLYGANWGDLVGGLSLIMSRNGLLGVGNFLIIVVAVLGYLKLRKRPDVIRS